MIGDPIRGPLAQYGERIKRSLRREVATASREGGGVRSVLRAVRKAVGPDAVRWRFESTGTTETLRYYRAGILETVWDRMRGDDWGYEWRAQLDDRMCIACLMLHGQRFAKDNYPDYLHPSCRCQPIPIRLSAGSRVSGDDWLRSQPEVRQRSWLGDEHIAAFHRGVPLRDMVTVKRTPPEWAVVTMVRQRTGMRGPRP